MSFLSFDISYSHLFFIYIFIIYFIRECVINKITEIIKVNKIIEKRTSKKLFHIYIYSISNLFSFLLYCIQNIRSRHSKRESQLFLKKIEPKNEIQLIYNNDLPINKRMLLIRTFFVSLLDLAAQFSVFLLYFIAGEEENFDIEKFDMLMIFSIISIYIFSRIILKTYFYRHHYLSFFINIFCLIFLGIFEIIQILKTFKNSKIFIYILIKIFSSICYSLEDVIGKKALIKEFLSPYSLLIYKGVYELIILILISIPFFFIKYNGEEKNTILSDMLKRFDGIKLIILQIILMITNFIYNVCIWNIVDRFSPNHLAMSMVIEGITDKLYAIIFDIEDFKKILPLSILEVIINVILVIGVCIHTEIIIINRCGMNEYTKKKIDKKGYKDIEQAEDRASNNSLNSYFKNDRVSGNSNIDDKKFSINELKKIDNDINEE